MMKDLKGPQYELSQGLRQGIDRSLTVSQRKQMGMADNLQNKLTTLGGQMNVADRAGLKATIDQIRSTASNGSLTSAMRDDAIGRLLPAAAQEAPAAPAIPAAPTLARPAVDQSDGMLALKARMRFERRNSVVPGGGVDQRVFSLRHGAGGGLSFDEDF